MMAHCSSHTAMRDTGTRFIAKVTSLLEILLEYRTTLNDSGRDVQMYCIANLLQFYQEIGYKDLYVKYLKKLCGLHERCGNFAEAGSTLFLFSELLDWSENPPEFGWQRHSDICRTNRALKEQIYRDVAGYFEQGKVWEKAIGLCKELIKQYEEVTFEYSKLADLYQKMSGFYNSIMTQVRPEPEYFRVAFYGRGYPKFLQNKLFVYRGKPLEKLGEFKERIVDQFPTADFMTSLQRKISL